MPRSLRNPRIGIAVKIERFIKCYMFFLFPPFFYLASRTSREEIFRSYAPFLTKFAGNRGKVVLFLQHPGGNNRTSNGFTCLAFDNLSQSLSFSRPHSFRIRYQIAHTPILAKTSSITSFVHLSPYVPFFVRIFKPNFSVQSV